MALFRRHAAANEAQQVSFGATDVVAIANALGVELHRWYSERHGVPTTLTAQLQFDEQQRVAGLSSLTADGRPFLVDGALVETLNSIANPLQTAPDNFHMTRLGVDIAGGQLNTRIGYRHDEPPAVDAEPAADAAPGELGAGTDDFAALLAGQHPEEPPTAAQPSVEQPSFQQPSAQPTFEQAAAQPSWVQPSFEEPPLPPSWDPLPDYPALVGEQPTETPSAAPESAEPESAEPESGEPESGEPESVEPHAGQSDAPPRDLSVEQTAPSEWDAEPAASDDLISAPTASGAPIAGAPAFGESAARPQAAAPVQQRPLLVFDELDVGPDDLSDQLPLQGELLYPIPGPDRPDYCLVLLPRPLTFRLPAEFDPSRFAPEFITHLPEGGVVATVPLLVIAARFQGTQIAPDLKDLWVNVAYVTDNSVAQDAQLDFAKVHYAAIARINLVG